MTSMATKVAEGYTSLFNNLIGNDSIKTRKCMQLAGSYVEDYSVDYGTDPTLWTKTKVNVVTSLKMFKGYLKSRPMQAVTAVCLAGDVIGYLGSAVGQVFHKGSHLQFGDALRGALKDLGRSVGSVAALVFVVAQTVFSVVPVFGGKLLQTSGKIEKGNKEPNFANKEEFEKLKTDLKKSFEESVSKASEDVKAQAVEDAKKAVNAENKKAIDALNTEVASLKAELTTTKASLEEKQKIIDASPDAAKNQQLQNELAQLKTAKEQLANDLEQAQAVSKKFEEDLATQKAAAEAAAEAAVKTLADKEAEFNKTIADAQKAVNKNDAAFLQLNQSNELLTKKIEELDLAVKKAEEAKTDLVNSNTTLVKEKAQLETENANLQKEKELAVQEKTDLSNQLEKSKTELEAEKQNAKKAEEEIKELKAKLPALEAADTRLKNLVKIYEEIDAEQDKDKQNTLLDNLVAAFKA